MSTLLEACLQVHAFLRFLRLLQALLQRLRLLGLDICVHDRHAVITVIPILPEVTEPEVSLLFCGLWQRRVFQDGCACGPGRICLQLLHGTTCKYEGAVVHARGDACFAGQVRNPAPELFMTYRDKAAPLTIEGVEK